MGRPRHLTPQEAQRLAREQRAKKNQRVRQAARLRHFCYLLCLSAVAGALTWAYWSELRALPYVAVGSIRVTGCPVTGQESVRALMLPHLGRSMFDLPEIDEQVQPLLADVPEVRSARLVHRWPREIVVQVTGRQPVAAAYSNEGWLSVDAQGHGMRYYPSPPRALLALQGIPTSGPVDAPTIPTDSLRLSAEVAEVVSRALEIEPRLIAYGDGGSVSVRLANGDTVRLGQASQLSTKLAVYRAIRREQTGAARYVDVSEPQAP
ncbi:MAG TPA: hypothetical protein DCZ72_06030, partial [Armatimonadetes bacterium]|nr:hypothetical protein [Armatimonadota bacterium]